jgi:PAS domain S-box-containing protein
MTDTADTIHVLHVDDDPEFTDLTAAFLRREYDFVVHTATHPDQGLTILDANDVDCVVSAQEMPGRTGIEFLEAVRETRPELPFILLTGQGSEAVASDAISAGVTDYLRKGGAADKHAVLANRIRDAVADRRAAADADRRRHRLEQILKTVPSCVVQLDSDGEFVFANDRAMEVLGLTESEVTDRSYNDPEWRITDLDGDPIPDAELPFRRVRDTGEPLFGVRHTIEWPDGGRKILSVNGAPLFGPEGDVESVVLALSDVTTQYERECERLRYRQLVDAMRETACIYDEDGRYVVVNDRLASMYDTTPEALRGERSDFLQAVRAQADGDPFTELFAGDREAYRGEVESEFGNYGNAVVEYRLTPLRIDDTIEGVVSVARDVTERTRRERELEQARTEYEQLIDAMNDAAWVIDADGSFLAVNQAATEITGYSRSALLSMGIDEIEAAPDSDTSDASRREGPLSTDDSEANSRVFETVYETADGTQVPVEVSTAAVEYRGEAALLGLARDITDRKRHERRMEEFASVISHDLRNPLNVAQGSVDLARDHPDGPHLDRIERAHDRMTHLIDDLLALARHGEAAIDPEPIDLDSFIKTCVQNVDIAAATVRVACDRTILADRSRLQQLFENLLRNSVDHGSERVTIDIGSLDGAEWGFYVEDDGPGIPVDEREDVFEAGYSTADDGTGFGLHIVDRIVEEHGWSIRITASDSGGARFEITGVETGSTDGDD